MANALFNDNKMKLGVFGPNVSHGCAATTAKPIEKPHPPIMNAGASPVGARFAAKYADIAFTVRPVA